jgi:hypothetical protein
MNYVEFVLRQPLVKGAIAGFLAAAAIDFQAFRTWKSFDDAHAYNWRLAAWRWLQGAVTGALVALGLGAA